ncbi:MAG TPA: VCBS repeat-containing protein [Candidatus Acidoferrum sp.]|nr:VCBS repeat-containing protein [Candidatus Acidoferrum sp.]
MSLEINSNLPPGNPVPFVSQPLVPDAVAPGGSSFTLTVNGNGFVSGATIKFNNTSLPTTYVSSRQLTAVVPSSNITSAGTASISVSNPTPGGGQSNAVFFPVATPEATVTFSNAPGSPIPPSVHADTPGSLVVGDFNADGKSDLSVAYTVRVVTLLGNGDGTFSPAPGSPILLQYPPWDTLGTPYAGAVTLGDFDNSGNLGLAVAGFQSSDATVLLGRGTGAFTPPATSTYIQNMPTSGLTSADFNGDGNMDLAASGQLSGLPVVVLLGYGDGAFTPVPSSPFGISSSVTSILAGDFNGDGKLDLALATASVPGGSGVVTILLGNGDGTFTQAPGSPSPIGSGQNALVVGDFNSDGKLDVAVTNYESNSVSVLLGNGDGTFTQAAGSPIPVGTSPIAIALGDFTGSGKLSLAVANYGDNTLSLLLGNGDGTFTQASGSPIPVGKNPVALAVGDFNGSGRLGLAVSNAGDFTVSILVQQ